MIQLNLLPDVKLDYIKAQRARRLILSVSVIVAIAAIAILVFLLVIDLAQKKHLKDVNRDIASETSILKNKPDISKVLTIQNQLQSLTGLHALKPAASRLMSTYLNQITPANVFLNDFKIDFTAHSATVTGTADSLNSINTYVDTLKFTTYTTDSNSTATKAFNNVVLTSFTPNISGANTNQKASYTISLAYDPTIFDITKTISLSVPKQTTTRSALAQPTDLFKSAPNPAKPGGGQ